MSEIEDLLSADEKNVPITRSMFREYDPALMDVFEGAASLYRTISHVMSQDATDDADQDRIAEIVKLLGMASELDLLRAVSQDAPPAGVDPGLIDEARQIKYRVYSRRVRGHLLTLCFRSYMFAATDLLRARVTPALGHLRILVESAALMKIVAETPSVAYDWHNIRTEKEGRDFFVAHQKAIKDLLKQYGLEIVYNMASSAAQHARLAGMVSGLVHRSYADGDRHVDEYHLNFQEFDPARPWDFFLRVLDCLGTQARAFKLIRDAVPEMTDPLLLETRLPGFEREVARLWALLDKKFPQLRSIYGRSAPTSASP